MTLPFAQTPLDSLQSTITQTGIDWPHLLSASVAFLLLAGLLAQFAYKPVRDVLEQRRRAIAEGLANAEKIKLELAETEAARLAILKQANEKAAAIVAEARTAAQAQGDRRTAEASAQAVEILRQARIAADLERDRILVELRREVGALVVQTTSKVVGKVLTSADQDRLNSETTRELSAAQN